MGNEWCTGERRRGNRMPKSSCPTDFAPTCSSDGCGGAKSSGKLTSRRWKISGWLQTCNKATAVAVRSHGAGLEWERSHLAELHDQVHEVLLARFLFEQFAYGEALLQTCAQPGTTSGVTTTTQARRHPNKRRGRAQQVAKRGRNELHTRTHAETKNKNSPRYNCFCRELSGQLSCTSIFAAISFSTSFLTWARAVMTRGTGCLCIMCTRRSMNGLRIM